MGAPITLDLLASRKPVRGVTVDSTGVLRYDKAWKAP